LVGPAPVDLDVAGQDQVGTLAAGEAEHPGHRGVDPLPLEPLGDEHHALVAHVPSPARPELSSRGFESESRSGAGSASRAASAAGSDAESSTCSGVTAEVARWSSAPSSAPSSALGSTSACFVPSS